MAAFLMLCVWLSCKSACIVTPVLEWGCCPTQNEHSNAAEESCHATHVTGHQGGGYSDYGVHAEHEHSKETGALPWCEDLAIFPQKQVVPFYSLVESLSNIDCLVNDSEQFSVSCRFDLRLVSFNFHNGPIDLKHIHWILVGCGHFSHAPPNLLKQSV